MTTEIWSAYKSFCFWLFYQWYNAKIKLHENLSEFCFFRIEIEDRNLHSETLLEKTSSFLQRISEFINNNNLLTLRVWHNDIKFPNRIE